MRVSMEDHVGKSESDAILGLMELKRDPLFRRIPEERRGYYVERSLAFGREAAAERAGRPIGEWLEREGISVRIDDSSGSMFGTALRAQIDWTAAVPRITVYRESMRQLAEAASVFPEMFGTLTPERAADIHLAHEYYHWLEYRSGTFTKDRLDPVETRLGPLRRRSAVRQCGEVAAHAFARDLTGLPHLPNLLDYLYLMHAGELKKENFDEEMEKCRKALGVGGRHMV
ncbi:hypothetical protein [Saccharibacillus alkalitolerans]|uniref:Uncharacterized protein n=1 Tax=Saccharibacillus alkalitolerans TaxID=2705290 RepID=A0ABX0F2X7_9BACL|nr:hypothetical protein [Saccharibacillus alkalitolerans]NGZ74942.1 hypothetical protein [Saccharibacillus alkalitolerans]